MRELFTFPLNTHGGEGGANRELGREKALCQDGPTGGLGGAGQENAGIP